MITNGIQISIQTAVDGKRPDSGIPPVPTDVRIADDGIYRITDDNEYRIID
jgi:hypothetical protein